jgi:hypothetical protein
MEHHESNGELGLERGRARPDGRTSAVWRVFVSTRTTSSWCATSFTCLGRLRRQEHAGLEQTTGAYSQTAQGMGGRGGGAYYFSTHGCEDGRSGAISFLFGCPPRRRETVARAAGGWLLCFGALCCFGGWGARFGFPVVSVEGFGYPDCLSRSFYIYHVLEHGRVPASSVLV